MTVKSKFFPVERLPETQNCYVERCVDKPHGSAGGPTAYIDMRQLAFQATGDSTQPDGPLSKCAERIVVALGYDKRDFKISICSMKPPDRNSNRNVVTITIWGTRHKDPYVPEDWHPINSQSSDKYHPSIRSHSEWYEHDQVVFYVAHVDSEIVVNAKESMEVTNEDGRIRVASLGVVAVVQSGPSPKQPYETKYIISCTHFTHSTHRDSQGSIESALLNARAKEIRARPSGQNNEIVISKAVKHLNRDDCSAVEILDNAFIRPINMKKEIEAFRRKFHDLFQKNANRPFDRMLGSLIGISSRAFNVGTDLPSGMEQFLGARHLAVKWGYKTGFTMGMVEKYTTTALTTARHEWFIADLPEPFPTFGARGDSGSCIYLVWERNNVLVPMGVMTHGVDEKGETRAESYAFDLHEALEALGVVEQTHWRHEVYTDNSRYDPPGASLKLKEMAIWE